MEYIICANTKFNWKHGFDMNSVNVFIIKEDGDLFETTEENIYVTKKFVGGNSPKKYQSMEEAYSEITKMKKKFSWLDLKVTLFS